MTEEKFQIMEFPRTLKNSKYKSLILHQVLSSQDVKLSNITQTNVS